MLASGFRDAPVCRFLVFGLVASSLFVSITDTKNLFYLSIVPHVWQYQQFWRLLVWQTCYTNLTELLFATMSIYHLRVIERLWGSRKYASFILSNLPPTLLFPPLFLALLLRPLSFNRINTLPAGPTPLVFAMLAQYHAAIPHVYKYRIIDSFSTQSTAEGITLSDKSLTYVFACQLALSSLPGSLVAAGLGWGLGVAWRYELGPAVWARWRVSGWLVNWEKREDKDFEGLTRSLEREQGTGTGLEAIGGEIRTREGRSAME